MSFGAINYVILFVYLAVMVGIGLWMAGRQKTTEDYFLAGRRMPWLVVAMSIFASLTSAISYMGTPSRAYDENVSIIVGFLVGPLVALCIIWLFYPFYHRLRVTTSYEYIGKRFGQPARYAVSGMFLMARLGWLGVVIYAPALALNIATGINLWLAILLMGALATLYTTLGGLSAVLWTDMLQFIILVGGGVWVSVSLIQAVPDGFSGIMHIARETGRLAGFNWRFSLTEMCATAALVGTFLSTMQSYGTDQVTVQRLMAVKNFRGIASAILLNSVFDIAIIGMLLFMGLGLFAYYSTFPEQLASNIKTDQILPYYIMHGLPKGVSGLVITAIFAAAMSSMDSGIHSLSTVITNDFIKPLRNAPLTDRMYLVIARILVLVLGISATIVAFWVSSFEHIIKAAIGILGIFNGPILAMFVLGVLTRRGNFVGWLIGTIPGIALTCYLWKYTNIHWYYYMPASFASTLVIGYLASLVVGRSIADKELTVYNRLRPKSD